MTEPTKEQFLKDVAAHQTTIKRNDGLYRHAEFRGPHGWHHWFEIVTWPNVLVIRVDMETWVFSRIEDMFAFFRPSKFRLDEARISPKYWQEKLQCGRKDAKKFTIEALRKDAISCLDNYDEEELPPDMRDRVIAELESEVFCFSDYEKHEALTALYNFNQPRRGEKREHPVTFDATDGPHGLEWDYHYIWCLWAIVWGIQQFDSATKEAGASA